MFGVVTKELTFTDILPFYGTSFLPNFILSLMVSPCNIWSLASETESEELTEEAQKELEHKWSAFCQRALDTEGGAGSKPSTMMGLFNLHGVVLYYTIL